MILDSYNALQCLVFAALSALCAYMISYYAARKKVVGALDAVQNGLLFFDRNGRFMIANAFARKLFLFSNHKLPETLSGFLDFMYDHAVDSEDASIQNLLGQKTMEGLEFRELLDIENGLFLVEVKKTTSLKTVVSMIDVNEAFDYEKRVLRLRKFSHTLYHALEVATNGVVVMRAGQHDNRVVFANPSFCKIVGVDKDDVIDEQVTDIFSVLSDGMAQDKIKSAMLKKNNCDIEISIEDDANKVFWYGLKLTYVEPTQVTDELFIGVLTDLTALKNREAEFFHAQKLEALGQMAAGLAHDFNNVLSIIDGYARLAASDFDEQDQTYNYMERIRMASDRGADLIKKMLTFSRHQIVLETVIDLGSILKEQEALLMPLLDASIRLQVIADRVDMNVECPPDSFTQILMNLVVNARDAMPDGGTLTLDVKPCKRVELPEKVRQAEEREYNGVGRDFACLIVGDTGTGMRQETINRIFDPFYTTKDQGQGTGLGLSMVYGLVRQVKGYVDVDSTYGYGTTMKVYFPLTDKQPNRLLSGSLDDVENLNLKGFTAMVAEDEPDLLKLISSMLEKMGMKVLRAVNGMEALSLQDDYDGQIDVLVTDVVMPEMDGIELYELVTAMRPEIKTVFMSGYPAGSRNHKRDLPEGADFMAKPIRYEELAGVIYRGLHAGEAGVQGQSARKYWVNSHEAEG